MEVAGMILDTNIRHAATPVYTFPPFPGVILLFLLLVVVGQLFRTVLECVSACDGHEPGRPEPIMEYAGTAAQGMGREGLVCVSMGSWGMQAFPLSGS